jgi:hypothetical protein
MNSTIDFKELNAITEKTQDIAIKKLGQFMMDRKSWLRMHAPRGLGNLSKTWVLTKNVTSDGVEWVVSTPQIYAKSLDEDIHWHVKEDVVGKDSFSDYSDKANKWAKAAIDKWEVDIRERKYWYGYSTRKQTGSKYKADFTGQAMQVGVIDKLKEKLTIEIAKELGGK